MVLLLVLAAALAIVVALLVSDVGGVYADLVAAVVERARRLGQGALRMISMRYHIVSLAAMFLALALGIVLGATKISSPAADRPAGRQRELTSQHDELSTENEELTDRVTGDEKFAGPSAR